MKLMYSWRTLRKSAKLYEEGSIDTAYPKTSGQASKLPLVLVLLDQSSEIKEEYREWRSVVDKGYILAMPHASNEYWSGESTGYWNSDKLQDLIESYVNELNNRISIDSKNSVIGGLSIGGVLALMLALTGKISVYGFVIVAPGGIYPDNPEKWQPIIDEAKGRNIRGIIIRGEQNEVIPRDHLVRSVEMLNNSGIKCDFIEYPNLGHWYPSDFSSILKSFMENCDISV